jgi:hypothetical protein
MSEAGRRRTIASSSEMLVLRDRLGLGRRRKTLSREPEKGALLLELALRKIERAERDNFVLVGFRKRRVRTG